MTKRIPFSLILSFILFPAVFAGGGINTITQNDLRSHIEFLAAPELEGREAPRRGAEIAARYIATRFEQYGLQILPGADEYYQQVPLMVMTPDLQSTIVTFDLDGIKRILETDREIFFLPKGGDDIDISAQVVFCGYGISAPEYNYNDYDGVDVKGKIVLALSREPQEKDTASVFNGVKNTKYSLPVVKSRLAEQHGASALVILPHPGDPPVINTLEKQRANLTEPLVQLKDKTQAFPVFYLSETAAAELLNGKINLASFIADVDTRLTPASQSLPDISGNIQIRFQNKSETASPNVVGYFPGSDPNLQDEYLIIGAHYDHEGIAPDGSYFPGADDNASGVAGLLELAEAFALGKKPPKRSILFLAFAAEEKGTLGSLYYSQNPLLLLEKAAAMFNMDEIGRNGASSYRGFSDRELAEQGKNRLMIFYSAQTPLLEEWNRTANKNLRLDLEFFPETKFFGSSDQVNFHQQNIPSVFYFTGFHPDYTSPSDTPDKINYPKMEKIVKLIYLSGETILNGKTKPVFDLSAPAAAPAKKTVMSF